MTQQQAEDAAELVAFFLKDDREEEDATPGPYEQGANQIKRDTMSDLFGDVL